MNKDKHSLRNFAVLQSWEASKLLKEIPPYLNSDFWYKRSKFSKWHCFRKIQIQILVVQAPGSRGCWGSPPENFQGAPGTPCKIVVMLFYINNNDKLCFFYESGRQADGMYF